MRTRTKGIQLTDDGERIVDKLYRGVRIFERLGRISQDEAEAWVRQRQARIDTEQAQQSGESTGAVTFTQAAKKYLRELQEGGDTRTLDTISGHVLLLDGWVGDVPLRLVCNDTFAKFRADRLAGQNAKGETVRRVKPSTVNRALEVARTVTSRAARVWRTEAGVPWLGAAPLIEMLDEKATKRKPRPITWGEQGLLLPRLPGHIQRMALFCLNTGAREANVCGLKWEWEVPVPEVGRSVFVVPASAFKGKRDHVLVLNDVAWRIVEAERGKHPDYVFVYRRERVKNIDQEPVMKYHRVRKINNTAFQTAREAVGLAMVRVHDFRHTYGQRLRDAGVHKEDRDLLLGHASGEMSDLYATATVARLVELANRVSETRDRTTLLRVVNG